MRYAALPLAVAALIVTTECRADDVPPSGDAAMVAGAATIVLPLSVGSLFVAPPASTFGGLLNAHARAPFARFSFMAKPPRAIAVPW